MKYCHTQTTTVTIIAASLTGANAQVYAVLQDMRITGISIQGVPVLAAGAAMVPTYKFTLSGTSIAQHLGNALTNQQFSTIVGGDKFRYPLDIPVKAGGTFTTSFDVSALNTDAANQSFTMQITLWYEMDM